MSNALPFGTSVICISHEGFEQTQGRVLGFDPINSKYFIKTDEEREVWLVKEVVVPLEKTNCLR